MIAASRLWGCGLLLAARLRGFLVKTLASYELGKASALCNELVVGAVFDDLSSL